MGISGQRTYRLNLRQPFCDSIFDQDHFSALQRTTLARKRERLLIYHKNLSRKTQRQQPQSCQTMRQCLQRRTTQAYRKETAPLVVAITWKCVMRDLIESRVSYLYVRSCGTVIKVAPLLSTPTSTLPPRSKRILSSSERCGPNSATWFNLYQFAYCDVAEFTKCSPHRLEWVSIVPQRTAV